MVGNNATSEIEEWAAKIVDDRMNNVKKYPVKISRT